MGIKNLNKFLEKQVKEAYQDVSIEEFRGERIAIDSGIYMYKHMANALTTVCNQTNFLIEDLDRDIVIRLWINKTVNALCTWLSYNIIPVLIFDGKPCAEKSDTLDARRKEKNLKREKIALLQAQIKLDPFLCPPSLIADLKKELSSLIEFSPEEKLLYKNVLKSLGIPCIQSTTEAEQLCSMMCIEGYVKGVYTLDIDVLVYGCPFMIKDFSENTVKDEFGYTSPMLKCVKIDKILSTLDISQSLFVDLCIMCGCDYNESIKRLGPVKAFKLLKEHGCIENIPLNTECYKYEFCRNQFKTIKSESLVEEGELNNLNMKNPNNEYIKYTKLHISKLRSYVSCMK